MKTRIVLVGLLAAGLVLPTFGQLTDSFTATTSNWGTPIFTAVGPPAVGSSSVSMTQDNGNGRVDWQVTLGGASNSDNRFMPLQAYVGSYDSNWSISFDTVNSFSAGTGQSVQIGLLAVNSAGYTSSLTADYLKLVLVQADNAYGGLAQGNVIHYGNHSNTVADPYSTSSGVGSTATLRVDYNASSHTLAAYNGATLLRTFGIAGSGGDGTALDWGMTTGGTFYVGLYAQASTIASGAGFTLPAGTAYADSFTSTSLTAPVPEPATYALLTGLVALGFVWWRRKLR